MRRRLRTAVRALPAVALLAVCALRWGRPAVPDPATAAVLVVADGCPGIDAQGGGTVVASGRVLTAAHVVAGSTAVTVRHGDRQVPATVVVLDPIHDLAVLAIDAGFAHALRIAPATTGDRGAAMVVRDGVPTRVPVVVHRLITLQTEDIYLDAVHDRDALELDADIEPGDSGAAVVVAGRVVGVVFARNRQEPHRAYAIDPGPVLGTLDAAEAVPTGACARVT